MNKKIQMGILGLIVWGLFFSVGWAIPKKMPDKQPADQAQVMDSIQLHQMAYRLKQFSSRTVSGSASSVTAHSTSPSILSNSGLKINPHAMTIDRQPMLFRLIRDTQLQTVRFMSYTSPSVKMADKQPGMAAMQQIGMDFLTQNRYLFKLDSPQDELRLVRMTSDLLPTNHLVYQQYFQDIPIWGKQLALHINSAGEVYACNGGYIPTPSMMEALKDNIPSDRAVAISLDDLSRYTPVKSLNPDQQKLLSYSAPKATAYIWAENDTQVPRYIWQVEIRPNLVERWYYFIDRETGRILERYNATMQDGPATAQAVDGNGQTQTIHSYLYQGSYYMLDASRPMWSAQQSDPIGDPQGGILSLDVRNTDIDQATFYYITSTTNTWSDPIAVSAHSALGKTYQYYYDTHQRNSLDNNKKTIISVIHVTDEGKSYANAYWNGQIVVFGDGGDYFKPLANGLDVVAHELTHGVVEFTVDLEYKFQSGALNEGFADWGGAMVDRDDWLVGEDIVTQPMFPAGVPMRDMSDPHNQGTSSDHYWLPAHMSEYQTMELDDDNGGVHVNVGIINKATYLIGTSLGKDKLEKIYYKVLDAHYLTKQAEFVDMRIACIQAASDLYGATSNEVNAVKSAFDQVGITGDDPTQPDPDEPSVVGDDWVAFIYYTGNGSTPLYRAKSKLADVNQDVKLITATNVSTGSGCSITISDNGSVIYFIDQDHYIRGIYTDGSGEQTLSNSGMWSSIALSPDGTQLAATSIYSEPIIYLFDLSQGTAQQIELYIPTTSHETYQSKPQFADALDWNISGDLIVYDTYVSRKLATGDSLYYWDINLLNPSSGTITRPFPLEEEGISLGNPNFSQTSQYVFCFDMMVDNYNQTGQSADFIVGANLYTGETGQIFGYYSTEPFYPCYSINDDSLIFHFYNSSSSRYELYKVKLDENKIQSTEQPIGFLNPCIYPKWFAIGTRPTSVLESSFNLKDSKFSYHYPNPFNPSATIVYQLPSTARIDLEIYDLSGRRIKVLQHAEMPAGTYQTVWDGTDQAGMPMGSGIYFYKLQILDQTGTRATETQKMMLIK